MKNINSFILLLCLTTFYWACNPPSPDTATESTSVGETSTEQSNQTPSVAQRLAKYVPVKLTTDISALTDKEKKMIPILIEAGKIMNGLFLYEAYGDNLEALKNNSSPDVQKFIDINYGPWDRLDGNASFVENVGAKPAGANFYPKDMSKEEFEAADIKDKTSLYTFIRRDENKKLISIPYHEKFKAEVSKASQLLEQAAELADAVSYTHLTLPTTPYV